MTFFRAVKGWMIDKVRNTEIRTDISVECRRERMEKIKIRCFG